MNQPQPDADVIALRRHDMQPCAADTLDAWHSGWIGISAYGHETHGFAEMAITGTRDAEARISWLAPNGEVYTPFRLRHDAARGCVQFLTSFEDASEDEDDGEDEDAIPEPDVGWSVDATVDADADLAPLYADRDAVLVDELFTRMAALHAESFQILTAAHAQDLLWDHYWKPGPDRTALWRPVDVGRGLAPFTVRSAPQPVEPATLRVRGAHGPNGDGYLAELGEMRVFVDSATADWVPVFFDDELSRYELGLEVDIDQLEPQIRGVVTSKMRFLTGPRPMA